MSPWTFGYLDRLQALVHCIVHRLYDHGAQEVCSSLRHPFMCVSRSLILCLYTVLLYLLYRCCLLWCAGAILEIGPEACGVTYPGMELVRGCVKIFFNSPLWRLARTCGVYFVKKNLRLGWRGGSLTAELTRPAAPPSKPEFETLFKPADPHDEQV